MQHTHSMTVPQQPGPLPTHAEVLEPMVGLLLNAVEALHARLGDDPDWANERHTPHERDMCLLVGRYVCQMMMAFGLESFDDAVAEAVASS